MLGFAPNLIIAWAAVAGICAWILGFRAWALYLITPAVINFVIWPLAVPLLGGVIDTAIAHWWWLLPVILVAPFVAVVLLVRGFIDILAFFFGARVAGHVGGVFVTRILDWISGRHRGRPIPHWEPDEDA